MPYPEFDISRLSADERAAIPEQVQNSMQESVAVSVAENAETAITSLGAELVKCRNQGGATIFLVDADVIQAGISTELSDLIEKGLITHLVMNSESAALEFGCSQKSDLFEQENPRLEAVNLLSQKLKNRGGMNTSSDFGFGEALGSKLNKKRDEPEDQSLLAQAYRWGTPLTLHRAKSSAPTTDHEKLKETTGIQLELLESQLKYDHDKLVLANSIENLEQGLVVQFGNSVAISNFLEGLKAAQMVAEQYNRPISDFSATLILNESNDLASGVQQQGTLPGESSVLGTADEDRRCCVIADYGDAIRQLHTAALKAGGWNSAS